MDLLLGLFSWQIGMGICLILSKYIYRGLYEQYVNKSTDGLVLIALLGFLPAIAIWHLFSFISVELSIVIAISLLAIVTIIDQIWRRSRRR
jgi:hypothetical protein